MCDRFRIVNSELANPTLGRPAGKIEPIDTGEPYIKQIYMYLFSSCIRITPNPGTKEKTQIVDIIDVA
jgi:hypothetical protein